MTQAQKTNEQPSRLELTPSKGFESWLGEVEASLLFTTYQAGKVFLIGLNEDKKLSIFNRTFERSMAAHICDDELYLSTLYQLWAFKEILDSENGFEGYDRLYAPRQSWVTGDLDIHDIGIDKSGVPFFINTLFSCIASVSDTHSFKPIWKPSFISNLAPEDRCHLNGMAIKDNEPCYVSAVAKTNKHEEWRLHRQEGGIIIDVKSDGIIADQLSMPHSPRLHEDKLYAHQAGTGQFGYIDLDSGKFEEVCSCPGFLRGLDFIGNYAVAGISQPRHDKTFSGLKLEERLQSEGVEPYCAVLIIDLNKGKIVHQFKLDGIISEIYDVKVIAGIHKPAMIGFKDDDVRLMLSMEASDTD